MNRIEQAGAELGQAQLKLELELCFIHSLRLIQLSKPTFLFTPSNSNMKWLRYGQNVVASHGIC